MPKTENLINKTIDIFDKEEIEYWCGKLNCEKKELIDAVLTSGRTVKQVKAFLTTKTRNRNRP
jgi:hypothetical protein